MDFIRINEKDNVCVNLHTAHKQAVRPIAAGERVIKYGFPIGVAKTDIAPGEAVHTHNLRTALSGDTAFDYQPAACERQVCAPAHIHAYVRKNGEIGVRNDVWILPTVGCVNGIANAVANATGAFAFTHPYGCSQLGEDHIRTQQVLCGLIRHPNAGGVLVLGLGCENNNIAALKKALGAYDETRVRFLNAQSVQDEFSEAKAAVEALQKQAAQDQRISVPVSKLKIGLKCGGSDGLSGITANAVIGGVCDRLVSMGGAAALTEVPEMFGAEQILLNRCVNQSVFEKADQMIRAYKRYFLAHNQPISENPSPGNKAGGITTLEEKSLGCVQKGGTAPITDVLSYGQRLCKAGLSLVDGPGNDMVAVTNLTAAGCHMILFSTGRGTPLGAPVPTIRIASNTPLAEKKSQWIDFDAYTLNIEEKSNALFDLVLATANGQKTRNEQNGYREIAIFKDGVTL